MGDLHPRDIVLQAFHRVCMERKLARRRKFCWLPTKVWRNYYWRDGFRWFSWVWFDADDRKHYTEQLS